MSDFEELDPSIEKAMRHVPPASAATRDAHIAAALAEALPQRRFTVGFMNHRARALGAVAVVLVLLLSGVSVFTGGTTPSNNIATPDTTMPVKAGTSCSQELSSQMSNKDDVKEFTHNGAAFAVIMRDDKVDVYPSTPPCSTLGALEYRDALAARDTETSQSGGTSVCSYTTEPIARFADSASGDSYNLVLVQTDSGLSMHFEDRCDSPIASLDLP